MQKKARIFILVIVLFCSFCITTLYVRQNNTLSKVQHWRSLKMDLQKTVMASFSFFATRKALSGHNLDLGTWHGFNEVVSIKDFDAANVSFNFFLKDSQYISFHYNRTADSFSGFLVSSNQHISSKFFRGDSFGKFTLDQNLNITNLKINDWNNAKIQFGSEKSILFINSVLISSDLPAALQKQHIGFKGSGHSGSYIDSITVNNNDGSVWSESFDNSENFYKTFIMVSSIFLIIILVVLHLFRSRPDFSFNVLTILLIFAITLPFLILADSYATSNFYFEKPSYLDFLQHSVKKEFNDFVPADQSRHAVANEFKSLYRHSKSPAFKIILLGTSQTWGSGASNSERTIVSQYNLSLKNSGFENKAKAYGLAVPGSRLTEMSALFYELTKEKLPNLLIINLCINDTSDLVAFENNLKIFIDDLKKSGVLVVLSAEPFYDETQTMSRHNHEVVQKVSVDMGVPFINEQDFLFSKQNSGYLWWDVVHMSDYAQQLFGSALFNQTKKYIK
jgi:lysophospholipase L1-like esterase